MWITNASCCKQEQGCPFSSFHLFTSFFCLPAWLAVSPCFIFLNPFFSAFYVNSEVSMNTWKQLQSSRQDSHMKSVQIIWWQLLLFLSVWKWWAVQRPGLGGVGGNRTQSFPPERQQGFVIFRCGRTGRVDPRRRFYTDCCGEFGLFNGCAFQLRLRCVATSAKVSGRLSFTVTPVDGWHLV